jgi:hypothetical protein
VKDALDSNFAQAKFPGAVILYGMQSGMRRHAPLSHILSWLAGDIHLEYSTDHHDQILCSADSAKDKLPQGSTANHLQD